ncbi:MAG: ABC-2 family transporter protein [Treponema sp.]|jgi:ABC-2 type transport system permease protein|nr:ABC-2 family transporter protein [Treponema sp.]
MKKYLETAKLLFKVQIVYRFDVALTGLAAAGRIVFAWIVWGAVFSGRERVGDFSLESMLSYYVVSSFLASLEIAQGVSGEVSARILNGTFSKYMVLPVNIQGYVMSQNFGAAAFYALFGFLGAAVCTLVFRIDLIITTDPVRILSAVIIIFLGLSFMVSWHYFIGLLAFKFQDMGFFLHVQGNILAFLTGTMVPLSLLPRSVALVLEYLPFYYVTYYPAMLLTGGAGFSASELLRGLGITAFWTAVMAAVAELCYHRLRGRYDGVGI